VPPEVVVQLGALSPDLDGEPIDLGVQTVDTCIQPAPNRIDPAIQTAAQGVDLVTQVEQTAQQRCCQQSDRRPRLSFHTPTLAVWDANLWQRPLTLAVSLLR
jgi:hypothetical protein